MSSFVVRTNVRDLVVSIENVERGVVDIFIHGMTYIPNTNLPIGSSDTPKFYLEHARKGVSANFNDIFNEVKRGVNYHYIRSEFSKEEFKTWLNERLSNQDILIDFNKSN